MLAAVSAASIRGHVATGPQVGHRVRRVLADAEGPDLIDVLGRTGRTQLVAGALLTLGLVLSV